ncbi:MAG: PQQ-dependent sugar dehydrogenase, partial [Verrucomicrobia bacterium]|nr:PQQ-dependent sugar dehydrogenase [Cytophagales bacterium]
MKKYLKISFLIIFATLISCKPTQEVQDDKTVIYNLKPSLRTAFPNLTFANPIEITHAGDQRLFVVEQVGRIRVFTNDSLADKAEIFLDIASRINSGGEKGLLGLAFHPDFSRNGFFFVNYTRGNLETVVARYKVSASNPNQADANSEAILLTFTQPYSNHNGGKLAFGPDGMLYVSSGDGGSGGDPQNNSQNRENLLGKILRIDVNGKDKGNYSIPSDNPYKNNTQRFREEIWAYGLRNPWRMSFDRKTGELWAGDVGQNKREEIDIIVKGGNYG